MTMKNIMINRIAILALVPLLFFAACTPNKKDKGHTHENVLTYTCPMHPQIVQEKPGSCPICGMDLVVFNKNSAATFLTLDERQQALANITTLVVGLNGWNTEQQINGRLVVNPEKTAYISSKISGRLEQLYVRQTGEKITKGQPLYKIYSEQLATLQQEYLLAYAQAMQFPADRVFAELLTSSMQKLNLYGQSANQIKQLQSAKKTDPYFTFTAPANGIVAELAVTEGQYVTEGSPIIRLEGYQSLWVEADIYPAEAGIIKDGQKLKVVIPGWEQAPQIMTVQFISPVLQSDAQIIQIRGEIPNPNHQWQPGLQADLFVPIVSKEKVMSLPLSAVIRSEQGAHVWVETAKGQFEPKIVKTGTESFDAIEITEGLLKGDQVVITGAYLLYSEYILKKGSDPIAGLKI